MPEQTIKTNAAIIEELTVLMELQKKLIDLFRESNNKDYLNQFEKVSRQFHDLRRKLKDPDIKNLK